VTAIDGEAPQISSSRIDCTKEPKDVVIVTRLGPPTVGCVLLCCVVVLCRSTIRMNATFLMWDITIRYRRGITDDCAYLFTVQYEYSSSNGVLVARMIVIVLLKRRLWNRTF